MSISEPSKITVPFGESGIKNAIPQEANNATGKAGFDKGFPERTMLPKASGGIPPSGMDFNGILFSITEVLRYMQAGGRPTFSAELSAAIGGYPKSALVLGDDGITAYRNTIASNTSNPNAGGAGWVNEDTAPTPPQFDNGTSIATTEFVQRALGNLAGSVAVSTTQTLNETHAGKEIGITAGGITLTLPLLTSLQDGASIHFKNTVATSFSAIACSGPDKIVIHESRVVSAINLDLGETATLTKFGTSWLLGGSTLLRRLPSFAALLGTSGYSKLPNGKIEQWGTSASIPAGGSAVITMPISMPSIVLSVIAICHAGANGSTPVSAAWSPLTASTFTLRNLSTLPASFTWNAIGT